MIDPERETAMVFGATGYTGRHVVERLVERGVTTVAHIRPDSGALAAWTARFGQLGATVSTAAWDQDAMNEAFAEHEPSLVFALLGTTRKRQRAASARGETYESVDRDLSLMLIEAGEFLTHVPRFIYLSALGANLGARLPYLRVRGEVEARLASSRLPHVIAQAGFITGPDRPESRPMERMGALALDGVLGAAAALGLSRPKAKLGSMTGQDLAHALVDAALTSGPETRSTLLPEALRQRSGQG